MTTAKAKTTPENNIPSGLMRENYRAARTARTSVEFFDVVCHTTWNFQIYSFVNTQPKIFHSLYLILRRSY